MSSSCNVKATHIFFSKKFQHICVLLNVNFNESLTKDIVRFEQLGPGVTGLLRFILFFCLLVFYSWMSFIGVTAIFYGVLGGLCFLIVTFYVVSVYSY